MKLDKFVATGKDAVEREIKEVTGSRWYHITETRTLGTWIDGVRGRPRPIEVTFFYDDTADGPESRDARPSSSVSQEPAGDAHDAPSSPEPAPAIKGVRAATVPPITSPPFDPPALPMDSAPPEPEWLNVLVSRIGGLEHALSDVRRDFEIALAATRTASAPQVASRLRWLSERLRDQDLDPAVTAAIFGLLEREELPDNLSAMAGHVRNVLLRLAGGQGQLPTPIRRGTIGSLIGPTGVGKTTTIAKIVAHEQRVRGFQVGIITLDNYRAGSRAQIEEYGALLNIPVATALTADDLKRQLARMGQCDLILIDTPGHSPYHRTEIAAMLAVLDAIPNRRLWLTLSATMKTNDLVDAFNEFGGPKIDAFIFTKTDESRCFGPLFGLAVRTHRPVQFLTAGQGVPNGVDDGSVQQLVDLLLTGSARGQNE